MVTPAGWPGQAAPQPRGEKKKTATHTAGRPTVASFRTWRSSSVAVAQRSQAPNLLKERVTSGGERGIRTLGTFPYTRFPVVHLRPLGHLSKLLMPPLFPVAAFQNLLRLHAHGVSTLAEREGFEPPIPCGTPDFESGAFSQLGHLSMRAALPTAGPRGLPPAPRRRQERYQTGSSPAGPAASLPACGPNLPMVKPLVRDTRIHPFGELRREPVQRAPCPTLKLSAGGVCGTLRA